jgi:hypothetical protein
MRQDYLRGRNHSPAVGEHSFSWLFSRALIFLQRGEFNRALADPRRSGINTHIQFKIVFLRPTHRNDSLIAIYQRGPRCGRQNLHAAYLPIQSKTFTGG